MIIANFLYYGILVVNIVIPIYFTVVSIFAKNGGHSKQYRVSYQLVIYC